jgi:hypothetical protein
VSTHAFKYRSFAALAAASEKGIDRDSVARLHSQLLRELALFEFQVCSPAAAFRWRMSVSLCCFLVRLFPQLSRAVTVCGANGREQALYAQQHGRLEQGIEQARKQESASLRGAEGIVLTYSNCVNAADVERYTGAESRARGGKARTQAAGRIRGAHA